MLPSAFRYAGFLFGGQVGIVNSDGTNERLVIPKASFFDTIKWSPDSKWLLYVDRGIYAVSLDGKHTVKISTESNYSSPEWSSVSNNAKIQ